MKHVVPRSHLPLPRSSPLKQQNQIHIVTEEDVSEQQQSPHFMTFEQQYERMIKKQLGGLL